jgi:hypothetical protein
MLREFTVDDLAEVQEFAREHLSAIEAHHAREPGESPAAYFDRISTLSDLDSDVTYRLGFLHGLIAGVGGDLGDLLTASDHTRGGTRRLRCL